MRNGFRELWNDKRERPSLVLAIVVGLSGAILLGYVIFNL